ncbi:MAG: hypothetical protein JST62_14370 [Bacteroidetes bacterium]|nr:hypothetical protein [Bacteroidota bacterium]
MIRKILYSDIDFQKYNYCVENAVQTIFFGTSHYLDTIITGKWEVLVFGDYQAVMPIPFVKKYGAKIVIMPMQTQQLGVFSQKDDSMINQLFLEFLNKNYLVYQYSFNSNNHFVASLSSKTNFLIFPNEYSNVKKNYSVHRRRNVRILDKLKDRITFDEELDIQQSYDFVLKNNLGMTDSSNLKFLKNMEKLQKKGYLEIYNLSIDNLIASQMFLVKGNKECIMVGLINNKKYSQYNSSSIIIDQILQKYIPNYLFNFHGSSIPVIADFFSRFGAEKQRYAIVENTKIKMVLKFILSKIFNINDNSTN